MTNSIDPATTSALTAPSRDGTSLLGSRADKPGSGTGDASTESDAGLSGSLGDGCEVEVSMSWLMLARFGRASRQALEPRQVDVAAFGRR